MKQSQFSSEGYLRENYHYFHLRDCAGQERDYHFHEFDKAVILLSGRVDYSVESVTYSLHPWDVLLVKHHTIHKAVIDKTEPYERVILYLDRKYFDRTMPNAGLMECFEQPYLLFSAEGEAREGLRSCIEQYEAAAGDGRYGAQALRDTIIMQFLIGLNRLAEDSDAREKPRDEQYDTKIRWVLSHINENLSRELTVEALAESVFLSKYHFMRLFKAQTGTTVHAYIRQKRLMYAARLIREGVPASQAASESGFGDYSAFHRAFKESFGVSPGELKK